MSEDNKTALVTGGAGFIGSHLVDRLVESGWNVDVVDDLSSGRKENLNPEAKLHQLDIRDRTLGDLVSTVKPSVVFHVAAQISVAVSAREPLLDADVNVMGSLNVLEAVRGAGGSKVVFVSTGGAMYGEPERLPADESLPERPGAPYGTSKLCVEKYLPLYRDLYNIKSSIIRPANVYGPRQDPHGEAGVVAIFSRAMLAGQPVKIFGDGTDERDYVFVGDIVSALMAAAKNDMPGPYNAGTGVGTSVNDLFRRLADLTGYEQPAKHEAPRPGDLRRISLDASRARKDLQWTPKMNLDEGLSQTVEWFRSQVKTAG